MSPNLPVKAIVFCCLASFFSIGSRAQTCDCPAINVCATCQGGLTSLTLRYTGASAQLITAADQNSTVFSSIVNPGATFTFVGSIQNDKFVGPNVAMTVAGSANATIPSTCAGVFVGNVYGSFTIVAALSKTGGTLCCNPTTTETTPPVITSCPTNITLNAPTNSCTIAGNWTPPTASDNCAVISLTSNHSPTDLLPIGTTAVTYTATDSYGNTSTCSFNVSVVDATPPVISGCPTNITLAAQSACKSVVTWTAPTASDNCSATMTSNHSSGEQFSIGTTSVTYTATDPSGNTATCSFNVTVTDTSPPVISNCPSNITLAAQTNCKAVVSWTAPTATDACTFTLTSNHSPGEEFAIGTTSVTYTATDANGNTSTCSFNVVVTDTNAPVISNCPTDITIAAQANCKTLVSWAPPTATDACTFTLTSNHSPGEEFAVGTTNITYTATDANGNASTCSFKVIVTDINPPVISNCPTDITVAARSNCKATVSWITPVATDVCSFTMTSNHASGGQFSFGTTNIIYTAMDVNGNTSTCSFNVIVTDAVAPVFTGCPANITLEATSACKATVNWTPPTATDNCDFTVASSHTPGTSFNLGTTTVTYTATDVNGNSSTCSFNVIITDKTNPTIDNCPSNITKELDSDCDVAITWTLPVAKDNCSVTLTGSHTSGSKFTLGTTVVTYTATDANGNITTCAFNLVVLDKKAPVISGCPTDIVITTTGCEKAVSWTPPVIADNCSFTSTQSHQPGFVFPLGSTTVTYAAADPSGNRTACSFKVTVNTSAAPKVTRCPSDSTVHTFDESILFLWDEPLAVAGCGDLSTLASPAPPASFEPGTNTVSYEFSDATGKKAVCAFNVTVIKDAADITISKVVTPNGDGSNDSWWLTDIEKFGDNNVIVVDRWGNRVYHARGYDNVNVVWNGTKENGGRLPAGTYFYTVEIRVGEQTLRSRGFVEVVY